jgi:hypothetical protein
LLFLVAGRGALLPRLEEERGEGEASGGRKDLGKVGYEGEVYVEETSGYSGTGCSNQNFSI